MSKQHTTDHQDEIEDATIVDQQTFVSAGAAAKSASNRTAVVAVIIAIIALLGSGYSTWMQWQIPGNGLINWWWSAWPSFLERTSWLQLFHPDTHITG